MWSIQHVYKTESSDTDAFKTTEPSDTSAFKPLFSSISSSPTITTVKLQESNNYVSWVASVELWFVRQGHDDHLSKNATDIVLTEHTSWTKIDAQLCSLLWHSLDPKLLTLF